MSLIQLTRRGPDDRFFYSFRGYTRFRSTWPVFEDVVIAGVVVSSTSGDDPSLPWMTDHLSDQLRIAGAIVTGASGVVLPSEVPTDGSDLQIGLVQRAFQCGFAKELRHVDGLSANEIVNALRELYPALSDGEINRAVSA